MKLKSFGLVEAVIATAILLLFVTGIFYLSAKSTLRLGHYERTNVASVFAEDFFSRIDVLKSSERMTFKKQDSSGQISIECFDSSKANDCLSQIALGFPLDLYPFRDLVEPSKDEFLRLKNIDPKSGGVDYKMKSVVAKSSKNQWRIDLEIIWQHNGKKENLTLSKIINE